MSVQRVTQASLPHLQIPYPRRQKPGKAAALIETHIDETQSSYSFPDCHWLKIRTSNPLERIMKKMRRRTRTLLMPLGRGIHAINRAAFR